MTLKITRSLQEYISKEEWDSMTEEQKQAIKELDDKAKDLSIPNLQRKYAVLCPFHEETVGSFVIDREDNSYHCLGCGVNGKNIHSLLANRKVVLDTFNSEAKKNPHPNP